jgi:hypothetical protein
VARTCSHGAVPQLRASLSTDEPSENGWHEELKMSLVAEEDAIPHLDNRARCSGKNDEEVLAA